MDGDNARQTTITNAKMIPDALALAWPCGPRLRRLRA